MSRKVINVVTGGNSTLYLNLGENYPIGEELSQTDIEKIIGMPISSLRTNKYSNVVIVGHENTEEQELVNYMFGAGFVTYVNAPEYNGLTVNFYSFIGGAFAKAYAFIAMFDADGNYQEGSFVTQDEA